MFIDVSLPHKSMSENPSMKTAASNQNGERKTKMKSFVKIGRNICLYFISAIIVAVSGYALWSYAPWDSCELPVFDYSHDRLIDWKEELGEMTVPDVIADWKESRVVTHALGRIDQYTYTNSKEAFVSSYKRGARVFEVDLRMTKDGRLVCARWLPATHATFEEYMQYKIRDQYTPLSFRDLALMMQLCPDVYIITDTRNFLPHLVRRTFSALVADAKSVDETVLDRIIPQLYNPSMIQQIERVHSFREYIFTHYRRETWEYRILNLIERHPKVTCVTFRKAKVPASFCETLKARNIRTYTHTVNSIEEMRRFAALGIEGFYSDDLLDEDV